jgi:RimJ/RimL family protein N-acetyltransferase
MSDGELVGHLMLYGSDPKDRCGTVSIMIGPPFQRHGFGHDALDILIRYAFTELGLHRLELSVNAFNTAGLLLYRKLGFVEEGRRRSAIYRDAEWHDHVLLGLLATEWTGQSRDAQ